MSEQTVTSDPIVTDVNAPVTTAPGGAAPEGEAAPPSPAKKEELSRLLKAESQRQRAHRQLMEERRQIHTERAQIAAEREKTAQMAADLESAKTDYLGWAERNGIKPEALVEHIVRSGTPEEQLARLRKDLDDHKGAIAARDKADAERKAQEQRETTLTAFAADVFANADDFPCTTTRYSQRELAAEAWRIAVAATEKGLNFSNREIANAIEKREAAYVEKASLRRKARVADVPGGTAAQAASESSPNGEAPGPRGEPTGMPRTLTNASAQKATGNVPLDRLPEKEQNRILAMQLEQRARG